MNKGVFDLDEDGGYATMLIYDKETAEKVLREYISKERPDHVFDAANVKQDVLYEHKACDGYMSLGDNMCGECGEPTTGRGRTTFTYLL